MLGEVVKLLGQFVTLVNDLLTGAMDNLSRFRRSALDMRQQAAAMAVLDRIPPIAMDSGNWDVRPW